MKTLIELDLCAISTHLLPSLINGDDSALSAQEQHQCEQFLSGYADTEGPLIFEPVLQDSFFGKCEVLGSYGDVVEVKVFGYKDIESLPEMCERIGSALPYLAGVQRKDITDTDLRKYLARIRKAYQEAETRFTTTECKRTEQAWLMQMDKFRNLIDFAVSHLPENRLTTEDLINSEKY